MISTYASGISTGTIATEIFLSSPNAAGKFRLYLDLVSMASGDFLEVRRYKMAISGGTSRVIDIGTFQGAQPVDLLVVESEEIWNSFTDTNAVRFSIKQTLGTARAYSWSVLQEDVYVSVTGTVSANVIQWNGTTPNNLVSGTVDAFAHYANPVGILTGTFIDAMADQVWNETLSGHLLVGSTGERLYQTTTGSSSSSDPWITALPGSYTSGQAGHILASRMPTGTVNANLLTWEGVAPNAPISGTVDAFAHYSNPVQAYLTGTVVVGQNNDKTGYFLGTPQVFNMVGNITGSVTGNLVGNVTGNVLGSVANLLDVAAATANKIADHVLRRSYANVRASSDGDAVSFRSLLGAVAKLVNKWSIAGTTLTITHEDDTTSIGTQALTATPGADPITQIDTN